jgi:hypothetical protein
MEMNEKTYINAFFEELLASCKADPNTTVSMGVHKAVLAYRQTQTNGLGIFTVEDMPFPQDMPDFMKAVEADADIREFYLCDESTGLMESLHYLLHTGWQISGPFETKIDNFIPLRGLHMERISSFGPFKVGFHKAK